MVKLSIRGRVSLLVLSSVMVAVLTVGAVAFYGLRSALDSMTEQENILDVFLTESMAGYAEKYAKDRLRKVAEVKARYIDRELAMAGEDVVRDAVIGTDGISFVLDGKGRVLFSSEKKGILAADESGGSIKKKFAELEIEDTFENRHDYRNIFLTTPDLEQYVNGVILFDETARDKTDNGMPNVDYLISRRIIPGIKVDQGLEKFENSEETWTKGLNDLPERLREYYGMGLRFAKWRAAFNLTLDENGEILTPTEHAISENCKILAEYAKDCQSAGLVPIVEPEVVYDGYYPIERNIEVTSRILDRLFDELDNFEVKLEACVLKVNMVLAGKKFETQSTPEEVGKATADVLKNHVPEKLAGVVFLSGGQAVEQATANLGEVIKNGPFPWPVTFSFARALQDAGL